MADIVDKATRSRMMSGIRGKNTKPEVALRRALHALGLRFRIHAKELPGKPDILLPRYRAAVLVHGCFWHRHEGCRFATMPSTRPEFWTAKFDSNVERDHVQLLALRQAGWRTAVVWECGLRNAGVQALVQELAQWVRSTRTQVELPAQVAVEQ